MGGGTYRRPSPCLNGGSRRRAAKNRLFLLPCGEGLPMGCRSAEQCPALPRCEIRILRCAVCPDLGGGLLQRPAAQSSLWCVVHHGEVEGSLTHRLRQTGTLTTALLSVVRGY